MMEFAHFYWFLIGLGVIFIITSIGLQHRSRWMWYLGWVIMFVVSGIMGAVFWGRIANATTQPLVMVNALIYFCVGLAIWVPIAVWWSTHRGEFDGKSKESDDSEED